MGIHSGEEDGSSDGRVVVYRLKSKYTNTLKIIESRFLTRERKELQCGKKKKTRMNSMMLDWS